jgi:hypothetical protein
MPLTRPFALLAGAVLSAGLALAPFGCQATTYTDSPFAGPYDAGNEACAPAGTPCEVVFGYPLYGDTSVVLRGSFASNGWTVGIPMIIDQGQWMASVEVPDGTVIEYKFFLDGTTWVDDPNNPNTVSDCNGGQNSVVTADCYDCPGD